MCSSKAYKGLEMRMWYSLAYLRHTQERPHCAEGAMEKTADQNQASFKDSERRAPEAVQSVTYRLHKKVRTSITLHTHELPHQTQATDIRTQPQATDIRSNNLFERVRRRIAGRNGDPCDDGKQSVSSKNPSEPTEIRKSRRGRTAEHQQEGQDR